MKSDDTRGEEEGPSGGRRGPDEPAKPNSERDDNVVQLPRDWLGPREDLVPFGPSAVPDPPEAEPGAQEREDVAAGAAVSPDDFWGERSAALQNALDHDDEAGQRFAPVGARRSELRLRFERLRRPSVAAGAAALLALAVVGSLLLFDRGAANKGSSVASRLTPSQGSATWPWHRPLRLSVPRRAAAAHHPVSAARHAGQTRHLAVRYTARSSSSTAATPPVYAASPTPSAATPVTVSTSTPAGTSSPTVPTTNSAQRKSSTPAFGERGALGPGRSPTR
jgi:hypothetical protein